MSKSRTVDRDIRTFRFSNEQLGMRCEWNDCREPFDSMKNFLFHIVDHQKSDSNDNRNCQWSGCGLLAETDHQFNIHTNYHAFHAKIKSIGENLIARKRLEGCCLSSEGRNMIPELPDNLGCRWSKCELSFDNPELFYRHADQHADESEGETFSCHWEGCSWKFSAVHRLREHLRTHTQEKMIACPNCGSLFSNRTKFQDHLRRQTPLEDQKYRCSHCTKILASERLLRDHMRSHINNYKCPLCDMTCSTPSTLRNHVSYRHSSVRPHACKFCDYSCKSQADLCRHLRMHLPKPCVKCPQEGCDYTTNGEHNLKIHLKHRHDEAYKKCSYICHLCDKKFARGAYLTRHLIKNHDFQWPSGHCRFRYKRNDDGNYQLQTVRYESIELTQEMIDREDENDVEEEKLDDAKVEEEGEELGSKVCSIEGVGEGTGMTSVVLPGVPEDVILLSIVGPDETPLRLQLEMNNGTEIALTQ